MYAFKHCKPGQDLVRSVLLFLGRGDWLLLAIRIDGDSYTLHSVRAGGLTRFFHKALKQLGIANREFGAECDCVQTPDILLPLHAYAEVRREKSPRHVLLLTIFKRMR